MAWQRKRKGGRGGGGGFRVQRERKREHILKPMLIYLSSQIKQVHKGKALRFSKGILEVIFKLKT